MMSPMKRRRLIAGFLFVSPWIVGFLLFNVYPLALSFYYSLTDYSILNPPIYIGLANYSDLINDELFWKSLWNTLIYAAMALPLSTLISIGVALLLNVDIPGKNIFRTIVFLPSLIPLVAMAMVWRGLFNGDYGILNYFLRWLGMEGPNWLGEAGWMKPALVIMSLWAIGNTVVIYLAGLQEVPRHLYEAADIDGANWWQKTLHVTLPSISPVIYFNLIIQSIFVLQIFVQPYVVFDPEGGAGRAALFYTMHLLNQGFTFLRMGYACAMAWILFVMIAGLTYLTHRMSIKYVHYEGK